MLTHALVQAGLTVMNPYTIVGLSWFTKHLGEPEIVGTEIVRLANETVLKAKFHKLIPTIPQRPRLVTPSVIEEMQKVDEVRRGVIDELEEKEEQHDRRRTPLIIISALTFSLPAVTAVAHHGAEELSSIGGDLLVSGAAHVTGFIASFISTVLGSYLYSHAGGNDKFYIPIMVGSGFVGRFGATFASAYYLTNWFG